MPIDDIMTNRAAQGLYHTSKSNLLGGSKNLFVENSNNGRTFYGPATFVFIVLDRRAFSFLAFSLFLPVWQALHQSAHPKEYLILHILSCTPSIYL